MQMILKMQMMRTSPEEAPPNLFQQGGTFAA
jgi:hypothetical protein